jgi:hypothetical protein
MSRFILAMIADEADWQKKTPEQLEADVAKIDAFNKELTDARVMVSGEGLDDRKNAKTVTFGDNGEEEAVSDGPYSDAQRQLVGFWVIESGSLDDALAWGRKVPLKSGAVEVRPLIS